MQTISKDVFRNIRRIQIFTTRLVNDMLGGAYRSAFKGRGMEFEEVREYQPGDEVRNIDWNVTARMNHTYVKHFREERELAVMLIVDVSASSRFGSCDKKKKDLIAEIGAALALSAHKNLDRVGLVLFSGKIEKYLPPKKGVTHVLRIIRELLVAKPENKQTDIANALAFLARVRKRPTVSFLISDFICEDFQKEALVVAKRHDLVSIAVTDPFEVEFPDLSLVNLCDLETGETRLIDSSQEDVRDFFATRAQQRLEKVEKLMKKIGGGLLKIQTDTPYLPAIWKYFQLKESQR